MKRALVLSGGGAKGAFQYGALRYILQHQAAGTDPAAYFQIISGVSVGALNGAMLAQNRARELDDLWSSVTAKSIYTGRMGLASILWRLLIHSMGILSNKPLTELIRQYISLASIDPRCDFRFGTVSVESGLYYSFHATEFDDEEAFRNGILASTAMPVIWPPVTSITTKAGQTYRQLIDGGIRNLSPLGDVIDDDPDEVVVINCNAEEFRPDPDPARNMLKIAQRALTEITLNEIFRQDLRQFLHINAIVRQLPAGVTVKRPDGSPYKKYRCILIEPDGDLGDALDFSRERIDRYIQEGFDAARRAYGNPAGPLPRQGPMG